MQLHSHTLGTAHMKQCSLDDTLSLIVSLTFLQLLEWSILVEGIGGWQVKAQLRKHL